MSALHTPNSPDETSSAEARSRIFLSCRHQLLGLLYVLVRDPHVAEDLLQDTWIQLDRASRQGRTIESIPAWCRGTARNLAQHYWRSQQRGPVVDSELVALAELAFEEMDAFEQMAVSEEKDARSRSLHECLEILPDRSRQMLLRRYYEGWSAGQIASELRASVESIHTALCRLRQVLHSCVKRKLTSSNV